MPDDLFDRPGDRRIHVGGDALRLARDQLPAQDALARLHDGDRRRADMLRQGKPDLARLRALRDRLAARALFMRARVYALFENSQKSASDAFGRRVRMSRALLLNFNTFSFPCKGNRTNIEIQKIMNGGRGKREMSGEGARQAAKAGGGGRR